MRKTGILALILVLAVGILIWRGRAKNFVENIVDIGRDVVPVSEDRVEVGDDVFLVEIADTPEERTKGLSGRPGLAANRGMLFLFDRPDLYGFWMKDMKFSINIIWIKENRVVGITEELEPDTNPNPKIYYPPTLVDKVLEVRAGVVRERNIRVGDEVIVSLIQNQ